MKATIKYNSSTPISARLFDPAIGQWYTGAAWSATEASAGLQSLTEKALAEAGYSRYSKEVSGWPAGDYLAEYVIVATGEVIAEESLASLATPLTVADYTPPDNTAIATIIGYLDTEIAAIKAKTDALPADPADASDISASFVSISSALSTLAGYIDTEVAAIKAKTDNLPADPASNTQVNTRLATSAYTAIPSVVNANVVQILAHPLTGTGVVGDEFGV